MTTQWFIDGLIAIVLGLGGFLVRGLAKERDRDREDLKDYKSSMEKQREVDQRHQDERHNNLLQAIREASASSARQTEVIGELVKEITKDNRRQSEEVWTRINALNSRIGANETGLAVNYPNRTELTQTFDMKLEPIAQQLRDIRAALRTRRAEDES